jgi:hypothetical protein
MTKISEVLNPPSFPPFEERGLRILLKIRTSSLFAKGEVERDFTKTLCAYN